MLDQARQRTAAFQKRLGDAGIDVAVMTDESSIAYLGGFWGYLSVEFGRPTFLIIRADDAADRRHASDGERDGGSHDLGRRPFETWEDAGDAPMG